MSAPVIYWDGSAVTSALLRGPDSERSLAVLRQPAVHLLSTLAWIEAHVAAARLAREGAITRDDLEAVRGSLARGPWRLTYACPRRAYLAGEDAWPLAAAGRWHLATAETLARRLPELRVHSVSAVLQQAAKTSGLALD